MAPHRNHIEARSSRTAARQYVSETHDHKPDARGLSPPSQSQIKAGLLACYDEIILGRNVMRTKHQRLDAGVAALVEAFKDGRYAEIKEKSEALRDIANDIARTSTQIELLANSLVKASVGHLNRRTRI